MTPWELLDSARFPGSGSELRLYRRAGEFTIQLDGSIVMNSRLHASEDALASLACARIGKVRHPSVLIGGLGMGYTLAAALRGLGPGARVVVAELVPAVVEWNRGPLGHLAGHPLRDDRVAIVEQDVAKVIQSEGRAYDAILLDVDNSPEGLSRDANDQLYSEAGLDAAVAALRPKGVLGLWSARPSRPFVKRLRKAGFDVEEVPARARDKYRGAHHTIWLATIS
ncbi:MAG: hypothetical protein ABII00_09970 [Elusimicrobiota bacterium]